MLSTKKRPSQDPENRLYEERAGANARKQRPTIVSTGIWRFSRMHQNDPTFVQPLAGSAHKICPNHINHGGA
jgi:hypothetical protein